MVAPPNLSQPSSNMPLEPPRLPSRHFCETGSLEQGERYHPDIHNYGRTPRERCGHFYQEYAGGKRSTRRKTRTRKNKKSRKQYRKSRRRH